MRVLECYGGGTAMGSVQVHTAERLHEAHGLPTEVHGTSVGAMTAAMRAADNLEELRRIWLEDIKGTRSFQSVNLDVWRGLFTLNPLRRRIMRTVGPDDLQVPCFVHVVDLATKRYERVQLNGLSHDDMADAMIASATQHGIHEAAMLNGRPKGDGGAKHVLPIPSRPWDRFDVAHVISCSPVTSPGRDNKLRPDEVTVSRGLEMLVDTIEAGDYRRLRQWVERGLEVYLYEPQERPGEPFDASREITRWRLLEVGRRMWQERKAVQPRPGLHLGPTDTERLRDALHARGVNLDAVLGGLRKINA